MNRSFSLALVVVVCLGCVPLVASQFSDFVGDFDFPTCDRGPDAFGEAGVPQTCIDVPFDGEITERCFYTYIPESCTLEEIAKAPLVVDSHGTGSCALWSAGYTGWLEKADEECIVVVWPSGQENALFGSCFDVPGLLPSSDVPGEDEDTDLSSAPCCCVNFATAYDTETIDPLFVKMAIDTTVESLGTDGDLSIDTDRIYLTGHSNGCMLSLAVAALYSETITAVACFAGTLVTPFPDDYNPVPIFTVHGLEDTTVPYDGNTMLTLPGVGRVGFFSQNQTMSYLTEQNGCTGEEVMDLEDGGEVVGKIYKKTNCENDASLEFVALEGVGHVPFPSKNGPIGETRVDTTSMAWDFIKSRSKNTTQESSAPTPKFLWIAGALSVIIAGFVGDW